MTPTTAVTARDEALAAALEAQRERLLPCVHCGFCLPACPTYNRLGDENDSPRGRLYLMGAVVEGRLDPGSDAFRTHIDRCLGCRACEPVCPSGVEYGTLLELARDTAARHRPQGALTRLLLAVMGSRLLRPLFFAPARLLRVAGVVGWVARAIPDVGSLRSLRLGLAMLAASRRWRPPATGASATEPPSSVPEPTPKRVAVLLGCVQRGLYGHLNRATVRVLGANGYEVVAARGQDCCGALHAHGGALGEARRLARANIDAFEDANAELIAVNTAGCGATMKEYGKLLENDLEYRERAASLAHRVRDVNELLTQAGPRPGAPVACTVAYDHPCHLVHGQGVRDAPLDVLAAIPDLEVRVIDSAEECCGGAGIYGITQRELGGRIGRDKVEAVRRVRTAAVCTPNPGCMMQIGAGLRLQGASEGVIHTVELLDESYRRAGYY